jgi:hypothetical protein
MTVRIDEITTADEQLEIVKMIFTSTWAAFAQKAEEERQAQSKQAPPRVTTKRGRVKTAKPAPAPARKPHPPQQAQMPPIAPLQMNIGANSQRTRAHAPITPVTTTATDANLSRQNGGYGGVLRAKPLIN